jgi:hypothetical protein
MGKNLTDIPSSLIFVSRVIDRKKIKNTIKHIKNIKYPKLLIG